jgi:hypothetical protein
MKRDMSLVRDILLKLEPLPAHSDNRIFLWIGQEPLVFEGQAPEDIAYHIRIMTQGELIATGGIEPKTLGFYYMGFRWFGHEFLDDVRDPEIWRRTKEGAKAVGGGGISFVWEMAKAILKSEVKKHTGLDV